MRSVEKYVEKVCEPVVFVIGGDVSVSVGGICSGVGGQCGYRIWGRYWL